MRIVSFLFFCFFWNIIPVFNQQNTILIIADDLSPDYLGFYQESTDTAITPNLRNLASDGIRFNTVWAAPLCSTTRAGILTGRYPFRTGVGSVITSNIATQLDTSEMTIARLLKYHAPVRYQTANVGKWHLHLQMPPKWLYPNIMGYDFYSGNFNGQISDYYSYTRIMNGKLDTVKTYATSQTVNDAINWLKKTEKSKPVFLWLAFNAPHSPYHLPPATLCETSGLTGTQQDINAKTKKYFKAAIQAMDTEIGRLIAYLKESRIYENTNIIFIGDNGNDGKTAQITDRTKTKGSLYNYGVRVPMVVSGPSVKNPGTSTDALVNTPDLLATIADLCGFFDWKKAIPAGTEVDSKSLLPILQGKSQKTRDWIFTEQFTIPAIPEDGKTIRNEEYQLQRFDNQKEQFFHFPSDPNQNTNLLENQLSEDQQRNYILLCNAMNDLLSLNPCIISETADPASEQPLLSPNPACRTVTVRSPNTIQKMWITNTVGETTEIMPGPQIEVGNLTQGIYFVHLLTANNHILTEKLSIQCNE